MPGIVMSGGGTAGEVPPLAWACLGTALHCPPPPLFIWLQLDLALLELKLGWPWGKGGGPAQLFSLTRVKLYAQKDRDES